MNMFIFLLLLPVLSFAHENCGIPGHDPVLSDDMTKVADAIALEWWSVSPTQFENAFCKTKEVPDYDAWFASQTRKPKNRKVKGFDLKNQPEVLLEAFRDLVPNLPEVKNSACQTVLCAVDEIWGPHIGRKLLYIRARHGYNSSEHAFRDSRQLSFSELDKIIISLADLPPEMENIGRRGNQRMTLALEGVTHPSTPEASADATIIFYDKWRSGSDFERSYALYHEYGHNVSEIMGNLDDSKEWAELLSCQVSEYGNKTNKEDFTESFVMYRYNGPGLLEKCPAKYQFLKEKAYKGREYLDSSQCGN